jgi:outer membrane protein assembly factor BamB
MGLDRPMNKRLFQIISVLLASSQLSCSLFKHRVQPYPTGLIFPLVEDTSVPVPGRIVGGVRERAGRLYFSTADGFVRCVDGPKKAVAWEFKMEAGPSGPPCLGSGNIYAQSEDGVLYCLSPQGELRWRSETGEKFLTPVTEGGGFALFGTDKGRLWALDLDGKNAWRYEAGAPVGGGPLYLGSRVVCGSDDGRVHFVGLNGRGQAAFRASSRILGPMAGNDRLVFFGTEARDFFGLSITRRKPKWKVRLSGQILVDPLISGRRLFALGTNSVLYCLSCSGGDIVWWANVPARKTYDLEIVGGDVVVSTLSTELLAFDAKTGKKAGDFKAPAELRANAVWIDPYLLVSDYDPKAGAGKIRYLRKDVRVALAPQKPSPRTAGEELNFTASQVGFFEPKFEFFIKLGGERSVARPASEKPTWAWYADKPGDFILGVKVTDAKETMETEIPFVIEKAPDKKPDAPVPAKPAKKEIKKK